MFWSVHGGEWRHVSGFFPGIVSPSSWRFVTLIDPGVTVGDADWGGRWRRACTARLSS